MSADNGPKVGQGRPSKRGQFSAAVDSRELLPGILPDMTATYRRHVKPIGTTSLFR